VRPPILLPTKRKTALASTNRSMPAAGNHAVFVI
jgi:hypothetical protein